MIPPALQTLPRDIRYLKRYVVALKKVKQLQRRNANVGQVVDELAVTNPDFPCFYFNNDVWTYRRVRDESNRIGNYFSQHGLKKGSTVSLLMENRIELVLTWLGLSKIGAIPALVNFNLTSKVLQHSVELVSPNAIICGYELSRHLGAIYPKGETKVPIFGVGKGDRSYLEKAIDVDLDIDKVNTDTPTTPAPIGFDDDLFYIYTSGTTGLPKAAIFKHSRFLTISHGLSELLGLGKERIYTSFPLQHTASGVLATGFALHKECSLLVRPKFHVSEFWKDCVEYDITVAQYIGETCRYLLNQPITPEEKQHKVRMMLGNGLRPELWHKFKERFNIPLICEVYGASEGNCNIFNVFGHPGAVGFIPPLLQKIWPVNIIKIDENDEPVRDLNTGLVKLAQAGEPGELVGKIVDGKPGREYKGYAGDEASSKKKILKDVFKKGDSVFRTGDLLTRDEFGYYYFKDRIGDTFRWKGENVSTAEVEGVINGITSLHDVVVYGVKIANTEGTAGCAAMADPHNKLDVNYLAECLIKELPSYSRPLFLRIVKQIEFTETHKLKKAQLKKEGYDINVIKDNIYFLYQNKYVPLTKDVFNDINEGKIKL